MLEHIKIVLVETSHPGNIGAAARAMKNMGLQHLRLVAPRQFPHEQATSRATGGADVLAEAQCYPTLDAAVADTRLVLGTSARMRSLAWPTWDVREAASHVAARCGLGQVPIAIVFGREQTGLTNDELCRCHALIEIPANPDYSSLNIASACQVICYELRLASLAQSADSFKQLPDSPAAKTEELLGLYAHFETILYRLDFIHRTQPRLLMQRIKRMLNRAQLEHKEVQMIRGMLSAVAKTLDKIPPGNGKD